MGIEVRPHEEDRLELGRTRTPGRVSRALRRSPRWLRSPLAWLLVAAGIALAIHLHAGGTRPAALSPSDSSGGSSGVGDSSGLTSIQPGELMSDTRIGHPLLGQTAQWDLFGRGDQAVVRIQLARGQVTTTVVPTLASSGPVSFVATRTGAIIRPLDQVAGYLVVDGHLPRLLPGRFAQGGPVFPGPDSHHVWAAEGDGRRPSMVLTGPGGRAGRVLTLPRASNLLTATPDGSGYLLVPVADRLYDVRPAGTRLVTAGTLLAVGPTGWLVSECVHHRHCSAVLVDRASGARHRVAPAPRSAGPSYGVIAPGGRQAAVLTTTRAGGRLHLLDLASGTWRRIALPLGTETAYADGSLAWSPDGRWLFVAGPHGLRVVSAHSGLVRPFDFPLPPITQLAVRAAAR